MLNRVRNLRKKAWNSEKRLFFGRDGLGWAKICGFYAVFYGLLAGLFLSMSMIVMALTPKDRPKYVLGESAMAVITPLNPGLGFRPNIGYRDELILIHLNSQDSPPSYRKYIDNLNEFLAEYKNGTTQLSCDDDNAPRNSQVSCKFELDVDECSSENDYGYAEGQPCVLIKLNKIYGWISGGSSRCPTDEDVSDGEGSMPGPGDIRIKCSGETAGDMDLIRSINYYSYNGHSTECADIVNSPKYFPFRSQKDYLSPYVWAKFDVAPNTLISVLCRAYADNIDSISKMTMRGMVRFKLLIATDN